MAKQNEPHWERRATFGGNGLHTQCIYKSRRWMKHVASMKKIGQSAVVNLLRHHDREIINNANNDIVVEKSTNNYELMDRGKHPYEYYLERKSQMYCINRKDVNTLCEWVVTCPKTVPKEYQKLFFEKSVDFLNERYGTENCIRATVHMDEATPHMHYDFIPAVKDVKHVQGVKICANDVMTRTEMRNFHPQFQKFMNEVGIPGANVRTGITQRQGGNRTVKEMKYTRERDRSRERIL